MNTSNTSANFRERITSSRVWKRGVVKVGEWLASLLKRIIASKIWRRKIIVLGLAILVGFIIIAALAPEIVPFEPQKMDVFNRLASPSFTHFFGTDKVGRDIFSRVIMGSRYSVLIGLSVVLSSMLIGTLLGVLAGFTPFLDNVIMRTLDGMLAFPAILLAIAMMAALGPSVINVILALSIVYMPRIARIVRSSVLVAREYTYVEAARALGLPPYRIVLRHILPNITSPVIVQATFVFAYAVLNEAALSFLGVGVPPTIPTWGNILSEGMDIYQIAPWYMLAPGAFIILIVFAINMVGDGLRDIFDPLTFERK